MPGTMGRLISLDGLDGSGKSTQCRLLVDHFKSAGIPVTACQDPGSTDLGRSLREILLRHPGEICAMSEAAMFMAARAQMIHEIIHPAILNGKTVVCDRFMLATMAYQGHGSGLELSGLRTAIRFAASGLKPDLAIVLDLPVEKARARLGSNPDRLERRPEDFHRRVRAGFLAEAEMDQQCIAVVNADNPENLILAEILRTIKRWEDCHAVG